MVKQKIRFNYFEPMLATEDNRLALWDMKDFLEFILSNKRAFNAAVVLGDEVSDLEWNSCGFDERNNLYYIQLSKLRSKNIPSRKKINHDKESLQLSDDEFLGEFNLLIYDPTMNILITQGNFYGLTTKQIALSLSGIRLKWQDTQGLSDGDTPYIVHLAPIIDNLAIDRVKSNKIYRKISIKGADYQEIAGTHLTSDVLSRSIDAIDEINGVNFEIIITMAQTPKNESLESDEVRKIIDDVLYLKNREEKDISMNITSRRDEENAIEYIDLFSPRLTSSIVLDVKNRATIGADYIFNGFKEQNYYNEKNAMQNKIGRTINRN